MTEKMFVATDHTMQRPHNSARRSKGSIEQLNLNVFLKPHVHIAHMTHDTQPNGQWGSVFGRAAEAL